MWDSDLEASFCLPFPINKNSTDGIWEIMSPNTSIRNIKRNGFFRKMRIGVLNRTNA